MPLWLFPYQCELLHFNNVTALALYLERSTRDWNHWPRSCLNPACFRLSS